MRKKNILHLINSLDYGGAESLLIDTCNASSFNKFNIHIIYFKGDGCLSKRLRSNIIISKFSASNMSILKIFKNLINYIDENDIDIIHTHMVQASLLGRLISKIKRKVCITSRHYINHNSYKRIIYNLEDYTIKYSDKIICVSNAVRNYLESINISSFKLAVIHNCVPLKKNNKNHPEKALKIGTICRLVKEKRVDLMLLAIRKIKEIYPQITLEIIGDGQLRESIISLIDKYDLRKNVLLLGEMDREKSKDFLMNWDIYLNASENESFGISILEAMSYSIPVIASNVGGIPEIIDDGYNGLLFDIHNHDLSKKIRLLISDRERRALYATNALNKLNSDFTIKSSVCKIEDIYNELFYETN